MATVHKAHYRLWHDHLLVCLSLSVCMRLTLCCYLYRFIIIIIIIINGCFVSSFRTLFVNYESVSLSVHPLFQIKSPLLWTVIDRFL